MAEELTWNHFLETVSSSLGVDKKELTPDTHLYNDIGIDSLGIFSLGMKLIKVYNIKLPLAVVSTLQTLRDVYSAMDTRRDNGPALKTD